MTYTLITLAVAALGSLLAWWIIREKRQHDLDKEGWKEAARILAERKRNPPQPPPAFKAPWCDDCCRVVSANPSKRCAGCFGIYRIALVTKNVQQPTGDAAIHDQW